MPGSYVCPNCQGKAAITIKDQVLCIKCGAEMKPVLLYSAIIWPSLKGTAKEEYGYDEALLKTVGQTIKRLETENLPKIEKQKIELDVPEITTANIYDLTKEIDLLIQKLYEQIEDKLKLQEIRKTIKNREISMTVCSKYATSSESPPEQYRIALKYLKNEHNISSNPELKRLIKKLEEEKESSETGWKYRGTSVAKV